MISNRIFTRSNSWGAPRTPQNTSQRSGNQPDAEQSPFLLLGTWDTVSQCTTGFNPREVAVVDAISRPCPACHSVSHPEGPSSRCSADGNTRAEGRDFLHAVRSRAEVSPGLLDPRTYVVSYFGNGTFESWKNSCKS